MVDDTHILARLADVLGIPVEAFTQPDEFAEAQITKFRETAELLEAWDRIGDRQARRRCLSYVKSSARRSEAG